jgi:hypothetical protein
VPAVEVSVVEPAAGAEAAAAGFFLVLWVVFLAGFAGAGAVVAAAPEVSVEVADWSVVPAVEVSVAEPAAGADAASAGFFLDGGQGLAGVATHFFLCDTFLGVVVAVSVWLVVVAVPSDVVVWAEAMLQLPTKARPSAVNKASVEAFIIDSLS